MKSLSVTVLETGGGTRPLTVSVSQVLLAGYTGRDREKVLEHIRELEELGVAPPPRVPIVYVVEADLLSTEPRIRASGPETSGEVEF